MLIKELLHFNLLEINILNSIKNKNWEQDKEKDEEKEKERSGNRVRLVGFLFTKGLRDWETSPSPLLSSFRSLNEQRPTVPKEGSASL